MLYLYVAEITNHKKEDDMDKYGLMLAAGVFIGNWLVVPLFFRSRTHVDGFFIGLIAAALVLGFYKFFGK